MESCQFAVSLLSEEGLSWHNNIVKLLIYLLTVSSTADLLSRMLRNGVSQSVSAVCHLIAATAMLLSMSLLSIFYL